MSNTVKLYNGRGYDEIMNHITTSGPLVGEIIRTNGDYVATVEFKLVSNDLVLEVNGESYPSITAALHDLAADLAVNNADGSDGSGNVANNVIGNYHITRHVVFGRVSLEDIIGPSSSATTRAPRSKGIRATVKVTPVKFEDRMIRSVGINAAYGAGTLESLLKSHKREYVQQLFNTLTVSEFGNILNLVTVAQAA